MNKKRILQVLIIVIFTLSMLYIGKTQKNFEIIESSRQPMTFTTPADTLYFVCTNRENEYIVSGMNDIASIAKLLNFEGYAYKYTGDFNYDLILACVNIGNISESNILIKDNYILSGNKLIKLDYNIQREIEKIAKQYKKEG